MLSGTIVPQFIDLLPQMKIDGCDSKTAEEFASCFEICLQTFKGPSSSRRKVIEDFILGLSGSPNFLQLAKSFALLAFTGSNKQLQTNNSFNQFMVLCVYSLDTLLDAHLNEAHQLPYYSSIKDRPFLVLNNVGRMEKTLDFLNKFKFLHSVIHYLLDESFDGLVRIPTTLILNFVQRVVSLRVNKSQTTANLESILSSNIIPSIYTSALQMLDQLITTCSTNLSTNSKEINKILIDLFDTIKQQDKHYLIEIKSSWYRVVCNWFNKLGCHLTVLVNKQWEELIIQNFFDDIQLKKNSLELQNKKQLQNERSTNTKFTDNSYFDKDELVLCSEACRTMDVFLINFSRQINAKRFQKFIHQLLTLVQDLYRINLWRKSTYFVDRELRLSLLKLFRTCLISFTNTSLLNNAITLLNTVLKLDKSGDVQLLVKETLIVINSPRNKIYYSAQDTSDLNLVNSQLDDVNQSNGNQLSVPSVLDHLNHNSIDRSQDQSPALEEEPLSEANKLLDNALTSVDNIEPEELNAKEMTELIRDETSTFNRLSAFTKQIFENFDKKNQDDQSKDDVINKPDDKSTEVLTNNESTNKEASINDQMIVETGEAASNDSKTPAKRATRSKSKTSNEDVSSIVTTRLTRSVKKKLEDTEQETAKKQKTEQNENLLQKQTINEDDSEVEEILKDFVDA